MGNKLGKVVNNMNKIVGDSYMLDPVVLSLHQIVMNIGSLLMWSHNIMNILTVCEYINM